MDHARPTSMLFGNDGADIVLTDAGNGVPAMDSVTAMLNALGWFLRQARENQELPLMLVADRCGVSSSVLSRLELARREPRLRLLLVLSNVLGVRFSDVMRIAEDEAFPLGRTPWLDCPAEVIGRPCGVCTERGECLRAEV